MRIRIKKHIYNDYKLKNKIIVGTRGWQDDDNAQDKKILKRGYLICHYLGVYIYSS